MLKHNKIVLLISNGKEVQYVSFMIMKDEKKRREIYEQRKPKLITRGVQFFLKDSWKRYIIFMHTI